MTERPNFVIIVPDQLRADALGCFGNTVAKTPCIDELAREGTVFGEAYCQYPVCAPSRASFLTGWYPHVRGHRTNNHLLRADEPNLLGILKDAGYHVTLVGDKGHHFAPGVTEESAHEYGFDEDVDWPPSGGKGFEYPSEDWARLEYLGCTSNSAQDLHDEPAVRTVERWLAESQPEPWVLYVPLIAPHPPFGTPEPWFSLHDRAVVPALRAMPAGREPEFRAALRKKSRLDRITSQMWREMIGVYYGMVSRLDEQVSRICKAIQVSGAADRTVSLLFSDHGEYLGDFGLIEKWWSGMERCLHRVPLIVSGAGLPRGQRSEALVELVDVLPTVLELASVEAPHRHFGRSLLPLIDDPKRQHRDYAFTEAGYSVAEEPQVQRRPLAGSRRSLAPFPDATIFKLELVHEQPRVAGRAIAVRDAQWTYVWRLYEPAELYYRVDDPDEAVNLAGQPEFTDVERKFEQALLCWQVESADVIPVGEDYPTPTVALPRPGGPRAQADVASRRSRRRSARPT